MNNEQSNETNRLSRRKLLATGSVALSASTAGCISKVSRFVRGYPSLAAEFTEETTCFETIEVVDVPGPFLSQIPGVKVTITGECDADYVILYGSDGQYRVEDLHTGERSAKLSIGTDDRDDLERIALVAGGEESIGGTHTGGEIVEETRIRVWFDD